jgi:hypothetical protein
MKLTTRATVLALGAALAVSRFAAAAAHHSYSMFDRSREAQVTGSVHALEWTNPHVWLWVTVMDEKGNPTLYAFEGTSPGEMSRRSGWSRSIVSPGDGVKVRFQPFKDGRNGGHILAVTLPNGQTLDAATGASPPPGQGEATN